MRTRDLTSSMVCIVLGGLFVAGSLHQGLMRRGIPGPGFLPFFTGLALVFISLFVLIPALGRREKVERVEPFFPEHDSCRKFLSALSALFAFAAAMVSVGYLLTTFLFVFFVSWITEPGRWLSAGVLAFLAAALSYLLFAVLLDVQLPAGFLGI